MKKGSQKQRIFVAVEKNEMDKATKYIIQQNINMKHLNVSHKSYPLTKIYGDQIKKNSEKKHKSLLQKQRGMKGEKEQF